jgi:hypothetical protein
MALARSVSVLLSVVVVSSLALLSGCTGRIVGEDLTAPADPTDPADPADPADPDSGVCAAIAPACDPGDENVGSEANCGTADYCYSRTETCNKSVVWCAHRTSQCEAIPTCDQGDSEVTACPKATPGDNGGVTCYPRTLCGSTILCAHKDACKALPSCNAGDKEVTEVATCTKPGVSCYSRTACNFTIYCYTP